MPSDEKKYSGNGNLTVVDCPSKIKDETVHERRPSFLQKYVSWRWGVAMITWFGFISATIMRNSFNMALVCMTGGSPPDDVNTTNTNPGEFNWDEGEQGIILSSFMYAGFLSPTICGILARKFGSRRVVGIAMLVLSILHTLTPFGARAHMYVLVAMRVLVGLFSGSILPSTQELWGSWAPEHEKVQLVSWTLSGVNIGSLMSSFISGFLCTITYDGGWPFVFYVFGGTSIIWCIIWLVFVVDSPDKNRWISEKEKEYISNHIRSKGDNSKSIPYKDIVKSVPLWAFITIQTIHMWIATVFFTFLPKYMRDVLRFPIEQNGIVSSVPYASRFIGVIFWSWLSGFLANRKFSTTANRKIIQSAGFLPAAALTASIGFVDEENRVVGVVLFVLTMFFQSCTFAASSIIPLDMAPRLASVLTGMFLGFGSCLNIASPILVTALTPNRTLEEWRHVYFMLCGLYVFGVAVFVLFGSAELQPWGMAKPIDNVIDRPSTENTESSVHSEYDEPPVKKPPRILIEREISFVSNGSIRSSKSNGPTPPAIIQIKSAYYLDDEVDSGNVNEAFVSDSCDDGNDNGPEVYNTRL